MSYKNRKENNLKILDKLKEILNETPDIRFIQALYAFDILNSNEDRFFEESEKTFNKLKTLDDNLNKLSIDKNE